MTGYCNCRFCKKPSIDGDGMVKYGVRHHAHFKCYLDAGKSLRDLHDWQIIQLLQHELEEAGKAVTLSERRGASGSSRKPVTKSRA